MVTGWLALLWSAVVVQRLVELRLARRNEVRLRSAGAREFGSDHYPLFFVLHTAWLLAWPLEAWARGLQPSGMWPLWLGGFAAAQILRYWTIATLGGRWSTRILVPPGEQPVRRGPFRFLRHPNYVAVVLELLCVPALFSAWMTAAVVSALNAGLLWLIRIPVEERALRWASAQPRTEVARER